MSEWEGTEIGLIPTDWKIKTLDKYIQKGRSICYGVVQPGFHDEEGIPIIRVNNLKDGRIVPNDILKVSAGIESQYSRSRLKGGEILISLVGNVGEIVIVGPQYEGWNIARAVGVIPVNEEIDKAWLKYWLQSPQIKHYISTHCNTTVQITLNLKDVAELPIVEPSLKEQKLISSIPSVLDRKIENLRQQNETLEQIAQTLFKHWFVDFEFPNADGKPYKSSGGAMEPSELGDIPAGWRVGAMEDVIEVRDGTHDSPRQTHEGFHLITSKHLKKEGIDFESAYLISESDYIEVNKRSRVETYDILLSMIGTVGLLYFVMDRQIKFAIKNIGLFKASHNLDFAEYIFLFLSSDYGKTYFKARLAGTTQSYLTLGSLREMSLIMPDQKILLEFRQVVQSLFKKTHTNNQHIHTLTRTRDVLLPKLMSGQIRVR